MYKNPTPVSIGIIPAPTPGHIVLIERSDGGFALPGGYVDAMEDASFAVNREVFEETGLKLDASQWQLFFSTTTPDNKLLLFSYYPLPAAVPDCFLPNEEVVRVFSASWSMPLRFPLHSEAVRKWRAITESWMALPLPLPACDASALTEGEKENSHAAG